MQEIDLKEYAIGNSSCFQGGKKIGGQTQERDLFLHKI